MPNKLFEKWLQNQPAIEAEAMRQAQAQGMGERRSAEAVHLMMPRLMREFIERCTRQD
ncbi:hypothetical protein [Paracoccus shanxieyensis]|uniref:Uncharacterized protein n=1 Tax=Paracoccus shanxieyensis TaxID=2675752 RepID=A0A6L6IST6_9RHOB|nr:hypothetical protein [Paracoccus shanxieyensis]MTH62661.1 hypothetical protein [Paracoccus shanxieyensis]MTH86255.1 hypothetical protein [Paracoccus shanxieyensis]